MLKKGQEGRKKMNTLEAIQKRRSIRSYIKKEISYDKLEELCNMGMAAPSAMNTRPWEFIIIKDKEKLKELSELRKYWKMLPQAEAAIVVAGIYDKYFEQNCAAAVQNILLAATDMGIGSVWLGLYPNMDSVKKIMEMFDMPENVIPFAVISLGYPLEEVKSASRIPDKAKIHIEKWKKME